jgi:crotonobetaine/carnitine-CoA ligase
LTVDSSIKERTTHRLLERRAEQYGNRDFLFFKDEVWGLEDFDREASKVAAGLQALGITKGDKVAVMLKNRPEYLFAWFGINKLGAVEVPINPAHKGELLTHMLNLADCRVLFLQREFVDQIATVQEDLTTLESYVCLDGAEGDIGLGGLPCTTYAALVDNDRRFDAPDVIWSDPFAIMFTSGTTGPSKGVLLPHNYPIMLAELFTGMAEYVESDRLYVPLPYFHGHAMVASTLPALLCGGSIVVAERFSVSQTWDDIRRYGCTGFNYTGAMTAMLMKAEPKPDDSDNPIRVMCGGGTAPAVLPLFEERFDVTLVEGTYGTTEIGLPTICSLEDRRQGVASRRNPNCEVKLVDDNGFEVGPNTQGEMLVRPLQPYCMMLEYYNMPEETVTAWRDLWYHTGDYLSVDEKGVYSFVDRKKDALNRRGENISSFEVERGVASHEAVLQSAAVAVKSDLGGDEVLVCVVCKPGQQLNAEELIAHCEDRMARFMVPRYVRFMDELPKTPTERVRKHLLRDEGITPDTWDREKGANVG